MTKGTGTNKDAANHDSGDPEADTGSTGRRVATSAGAGISVGAGGVVAGDPFATIAAWILGVSAVVLALCLLVRVLGHLGAFCDEALASWSGAFERGGDAVESWRTMVTRVRRNHPPSASEVNNRTRRRRCTIHAVDPSERRSCGGTHDPPQPR